MLALTFNIINRFFIINKPLFIVLLLFYRTALYDKMLYHVIVYFFIVNN